MQYNPYLINLVELNIIHKMYLPIKYTESFKSKFLRMLITLEYIKIHQSFQVKSLFTTYIFTDKNIR